jgi:hypothetical protein
MAQQLQTAPLDKFASRLRETPGTGPTSLPARKFYGLVELDAQGMVLYSRFEGDGQRATSTHAAADMTGLNFYTEVAPFKNIDEFRELLEGFCKGSQPAWSTDFVCNYDDGPQAVRVLLARIRERNELDVMKSVLVHIRKM